MSSLYRNWRALGALSTTVPLAFVANDRSLTHSHRPKNVHCSDGNKLNPMWPGFDPVVAGAGMVGIGSAVIAVHLIWRRSVAKPVMGHVSCDEANILFAKVECAKTQNQNARGVDASQAIKTGIEHMWADLVNWHLRQTGQNELTGEKVISQGIPIEVVSAICADGTACDELEWLQPVMKWIKNPKIMELLNYDGDTTMDFKEFALLLLLAMSHSHYENAQITKRIFTKITYDFMDMDGDGTVSREEFCHTCAILATVGLINVKNIEKTCTKRLGKQKVNAVEAKKLKRLASHQVGNVKIKGSLHSIFEKAFQVYDEDGSGDIGETEWHMFTGEWLEWDSQE